MSEKEISKKMQEIMSRIKKRREALNMSYQTLSDKVGISKSTLQRYETGHIKNMPIDKLEDIAKALCISPAYLMGWEKMNDEDIGNAFANDNLFNIIDNISALSPQEKNHFTNYLNLLEVNRKKADNYVEQLLSIQEMDKALQVNAAHGRTDTEITEEMKQHDDDIMNSDEF